MKRTVWVLILVILFTSCYNEKDFNGVWVGAYHYNEMPNEESLFPILTEVFQFKNGKYRVERFLFNGNDNKGEYSTFFKNFYLDSVNLGIELINKDSLVINDFGLNKVYFKLHDSLKFKRPIKNLINKKFILKIEKLTDTINFINDSIALRTANSKTDKIYWEKVELDGFNILLFDNAIPAVMIENGKDNYGLLQQFKNQRFYLKMIEIK